MSQTVASWIVLGAGVYLGLGVIFAIPFLARGAARLDPDAMHGSAGFKAAIAPGVVALWPVLLRRWIAGAPPVEATSHKLMSRRRAAP